MHKFGINLIVGFAAVSSILSSSSLAEKTVQETRMGPIGSGGKFFRCGLVHSSGNIYIGTYGPAPAIIWEYKPGSKSLTNIAEPGEYQLDSMVEAPNGMIYIGTAYNGLIYKLDPNSKKVSSIGTPAINSTAWIFTMTCTRKGEIYGAKGVGLFRLDWKNDKIEPLGIVPGNHKTFGPGASEPIIRNLVEAPDGSLWGDTNRCFFNYDPNEKVFKTIVDMTTYDANCYGLLLATGPSESHDCFFSMISRFGGSEVKDSIYKYCSERRTVEPVVIKGLQGKPFTLSRVENKLFVSLWSAEQECGSMAIVDPCKLEVVGKLETEADTVFALAGGAGKYFLNAIPGAVYKLNEATGKLEVLIRNPTAAPCRSLAINRQRILGADTYDCGHVFTMDVITEVRQDHGKVWFDDHRCTYGPAVFAGPDDRYFISNHSETVPGLWVTDLQNKRHWRIIDQAAVQLITTESGIVWGTLGSAPEGFTFDPNKNWTPAWQARGGRLFSYTPGQKTAKIYEEFANTGCIAQVPGSELLLLGQDTNLKVYDPNKATVVQTLQVPHKVTGLTSDKQKFCCYAALEGGALYAAKPENGKGEFKAEQISSSFGSISRGFFVLSRSGCIAGMGQDGTVCLFDTETKQVSKLAGPIPLSCGPAVDPQEDAWYYADDYAAKYSIMEKCKPLREVETTLIDSNAAGYGTFHSNSQKIVCNSNGIFMAYLKDFNETTEFNAWRLMRSTDSGKTFTELYQGRNVTRAPVIETDEENNIYLAHTDANLKFIFYKFSHEDNYRKPRTTVIDKVSCAAKYAMTYDQDKKQFYLATQYGEMVTIDGEGKKKSQISVMRTCGENACTQYPHIYYTPDRMIHYADTTAYKTGQDYWDIHYMRSPDIGATWTKMDGSVLPAAPAPDDSGPTDQVVIPGEIGQTTWLASFIPHSDKLHFIYGTRTGARYTRFDMQSGKREVCSSMIINGVQYFSGSSGSLLASGPDIPGAPLYLVLVRYREHMPNTAIVCLESRDNGENWQEFAISKENYGVYALGGTHKVTPDGYITGSFVNQKRSTYSINSSVYFFRIPVSKL